MHHENYKGTLEVWIALRPDASGEGFLECFRVTGEAWSYDQNRSWKSSADPAFNAGNGVELESIEVLPFETDSEVGNFYFPLSPKERREIEEGFYFASEMPGRLR